MVIDTMVFVYAAYVLVYVDDKHKHSPLVSNNYP
jgi:hypothetical protein